MLVYAIDSSQPFCQPAINYGIMSESAKLNRTRLGGTGHLTVWGRRPPHGPPLLLATELASLANCARSARISPRCEDHDEVQLGSISAVLVVVFALLFSTS